MAKLANQNKFWPDVESGRKMANGQLCITMVTHMYHYGDMHASPW